MKFYRIIEGRNYLKPGDVVVYSKHHHCLYKVATPTEPGVPLWIFANVTPGKEVEPLTISELKGLSPHIAKAIYPEYLASVGTRHGIE